MSSFVTNLNSSTAQEIVNWVMTADGRQVGYVHTADMTQLDFSVGKFDQTRRNCRQLVASCIGLHTADADSTGQMSRVVDSWSAMLPCVCGLFGHYKLFIYLLTYITTCLDLYRRHAEGRKFKLRFVYIFVYFRQSLVFYAFYYCESYFEVLPTSLSVDC